MGSFTRTISRLAAIGALIAVAPACGDDDSPDRPSITPDDSTQIANPASVFCIEQGGTLEIVDDGTGQLGYCTLPDGTRVEEWEYFRSQNPDMGSDTSDVSEVPDTTG